MKKPVKILIGVFVGAGLVAFASVFLAIFLVLFFPNILDIKERLSRRAFDSDIWKRGNKNEIRIRMVDDLLAHHSFTGQTRRAVKELLGPPDKTRYFREYNMVYRLGMERGFISIDSEWLVFRLGSNEVITEYRIVND